MTDLDGPGLLSTGQRDYLLGEKSPANESTMKRRIRQRILGGLRDFSLLYAYHDEKEIALTFEQSEREAFFEEAREQGRGNRFWYDPEEVPESGLNHNAAAGMRDAVSYLYLASLTRGHDEEDFAEIVRNAVKNAIEDHEEEDVIAEVDVTINRRLREKRLDELRERALAGEQLSADQLEALLDADPGIATEVLTQPSDDDEE